MSKTTKYNTIPNNNTKGVLTNNVVTSNSSNNWVITTGGNNIVTNGGSNISPYNNWEITTGGTILSHTSYTSNINVGSNEYYLRNNKIKLNRYLTFDEVNFIVNIDINGTKYYDLMLKNNVMIQEDLKECLEPILKMMKRHENIGSILKNKENEKC